MSKPSKHNCQLLDVDQDGIKDCVVVGENGLMTAINPINGKLITSNITTQGATNGRAKTYADRVWRSSCLL